ncbi:hypothetical protein BKA82DRAFT_4019060 [Pisolithus tinctorius]|nr:hypothetical protein BKA82DRAFT_4019060 [Pisolithus tinctorius]
MTGYLPWTYDLAKYCGAILCPCGMSHLDDVADMWMCSSCRKLLMAKMVQQPKDAMANFQYYVHAELLQEVQDGFGSLLLIIVKQKVFEGGMFQRKLVNILTEEMWLCCLRTPWHCQKSSHHYGVICMEQKGYHLQCGEFGMIGIEITHLQNESGSVEADDPVDWLTLADCTHY